MICPTKFHCVLNNIFGDKEVVAIDSFKVRPDLQHGSYFGDKDLLKDLVYQEVLALLFAKHFAGYFLAICWGLINRGVLPRSNLTPIEVMVRDIGLIDIQDRIPPAKVNLKLIELRIVFEDSLD